MSVRTFPYRTPMAERVVGEPWFRTDAETPEIFGGPVHGWDYATDLRLRRQVTVDRDGVMAEAGLLATTPLRLTVRSRSSGSLIRKVETSLPVDEPGVRTHMLEVLVRGSDLSGGLSLETVLELASTVDQAAPFTAFRVGSILWRDHVEGALDGDSGLLPVAPVSFAEAGLPAGAAWYISLDTGRWEWAAMGSLLVLLNTDNAAVSSALLDPAAPASGALFDTLEVDLVTDLVARAVDDDAFRETYLTTDQHTIEDDYSLGALVRTLVSARLSRPTETVDEALLRLREARAADPSFYRATVQAGLAYPRSATT